MDVRQTPSPLREKAGMRVAGLDPPPLPLPGGERELKVPSPLRSGATFREGKNQFNYLAKPKLNGTE